MFEEAIMVLATSESVMMGLTMSMVVVVVIGGEEGGERRGGRGGYNICRCY